jgi:hypothetical protein
MRGKEHLDALKILVGLMAVVNWVAYVDQTVRISVTLETLTVVVAVKEVVVEAAAAMATAGFPVEST